MIGWLEAKRHIFLVFIRPYVTRVWKGECVDPKVRNKKCQNRNINVKMITSTRHERKSIKKIRVVSSFEQYININYLPIIWPPIMWVTRWLGILIKTLACFLLSASFCTLCGWGLTMDSNFQSERYCIHSWKKCIQKIRNAFSFFKSRYT